MAEKFVILFLCLKIYKEIDSIESEIAEIESKINAAVQRKISGDNVHKYLLYFDRLYDKFTDKEKKEFLGSFISFIEIYPDRLPDGRILKSIHFNFPIFYECKEIESLCWGKETTVEVICLLTRKDK